MADERLQPAASRELLPRKDGGHHYGSATRDHQRTYCREQWWLHRHRTQRQAGASRREQRHDGQRQRRRGSLYLLRQRADMGTGTRRQQQYHHHGIHPYAYRRCLRRCYETRQAGRWYPRAAQGRRKVYGQHRRVGWYARLRWYAEEQPTMAQPFRQPSQRRRYVLRYQGRLWRCCPSRRTG